MFTRSRLGLMSASALGAGVVLSSLAVAPATAQSLSPRSTTVQAAQQCRNAYVSTTGAWGSARICWTYLGNNFYKASATGTVKDTKTDGKRAALYIKTYNTSGHYYTPRLALATKYGQVKYGSWSSKKVKWGVYIYVCRVDRFNNTYNCSKNG
ncbi:hypothetical protein ACFU93_44205 [Streptomyces sp. NPDC057611]|uniref:hypothetical protein n=1 Tax=Streptomyces sp. NPDC057611 TaxID=3346182 RepID=UPI0036922784